MRTSQLSLQAVFLGFASFALAALFFYGLMFVYEIVISSPMASTDLTFAEAMRVLSWHALAFVHVAAFVSVGIGVFVAAINSRTKRWLHSGLAIAIILIGVWGPSYAFAAPDLPFFLSLSAVAIVAGMLAHIASRKLRNGAGAA